MIAFNAGVWTEGWLVCTGLKQQTVLRLICRIVTAKNETEDVYPADGAVCSTSLGQHHRCVRVCVGVQGGDEVEQRQDIWMPSFLQWNVGKPDDLGAVVL